MEDPQWPRASAWLANPPTGSVAIDVVGVPSSIASISGSGARTCPSAVRSALGGFSTYDGERAIDLATTGVHDHGDLVIDDTTMAASQADIEHGVRTLSTTGVAVFLGGDNAITRPIVRGTFDDLASVGVITIDAHHDVRSLDGGPTNGTPIRGLIEDGLPGDNVVQIGIHSFANSAAYRAYCDDHGVTVLTMADVETRGPSAVVGAALDALASVDAIYVDFDIDVLDRAFAPGCPGARPGGMTPRQLAAVAWALGADPRVVAADLVEVDPDRDLDGMTVRAMANTFLAFASGIASRVGAS